MPEWKPEILRRLAPLKQEQIYSPFLQILDAAWSGPPQAGVVLRSAGSPLGMVGAASANTSAGPNTRSPDVRFASPSGHLGRADSNRLLVVCARGSDLSRSADHHKNREKISIVVYNP